MENSPHSILVGQGAQEYAVKNGFPVEPNSALQTHESIEAFEVNKSDLRFAALAFVFSGQPECVFLVGYMSGLLFLNRKQISRRPFLSSPGPLFQNEGRCSAFDVEITFHSHANKTHCHKKGCAPGLILKVRDFGTWKWPISHIE